MLSDIQLLREQCVENPHDPLLRRLYSDELMESDVYAGLIQQCVASFMEGGHDKDPFLRLADWYEVNGGTWRADHIRKGWNVEPPEEQKWRAAGKCSLCDGDGEIETGVLAGGEWERMNPQDRVPIPKVRCLDCFGTGDKGGLMERLYTNYYDASSDTGESYPINWRFPITFRNGVIYSVECDMADAVDRVCTACGSTACTHDVGEVWQPTARAQAWLKWHPTIMEIRVRDREPQDYHNNTPHINKNHLYGWWRMGCLPITDTHNIPFSIWELIQNTEVHGRWKDFATPELANTNLARAMSIFVRQWMEGQS